MQAVSAMVPRTHRYTCVSPRLTWWRLGDRAELSCCQVPHSVLQDATLTARHIHFGSSVAAICRGMHQREVSRLFTRECLCVRAYDPSSGTSFCPCVCVAVDDMCGREAAVQRAHAQAE